jgi:hypothetical protein
MKAPKVSKTSEIQIPSAPVVESNVQTVDVPQVAEVATVAAPLTLAELVTEELLHLATLNGPEPVREELIAFGLRFMAYAPQEIVFSTDKKVRKEQLKAGKIARKTYLHNLSRIEQWVTASGHGETFVAYGMHVATNGAVTFGKRTRTKIATPKHKIGGYRIG